MKMIRKMAALLIVLSMCIIFPCAAFAAPAHCDSTDSTTLVAEPVSLPSPNFSQSPSQVAPMATSKNFSCGSGHFAEPLQSDYYVIQGSTKLKITSMTWNPPECDITIGFFPSGTTGTEPYGVRLSGGSAHNLTITTENVPTGMYWIYVYNNGDYSVNGVVQYSVSE